MCCWSRSVSWPPSVCGPPVCSRAPQIRCTVVDPRWVKPVDEQLAPLAARHRLVAVVEDNSRAGGVGSAVGQALRDAGTDVPLRTFGIPEQFLAHGKRAEVLADIGLTPVEIAGRISATLAAAQPVAADGHGLPVDDGYHGRNALGNGHKESGA